MLKSNNKNIYISILILMLLFVGTLSACSSDSEKSETPPVATTSNETKEEEKEEPKEEIKDEVMTFTLEELKEYNGKDGNPAYIAVDGVVYDVSKSSRWVNGVHKNYSAGNDFSEEIRKESPHGVSVLEDLPVVGKLEE